EGDLSRPFDETHQAAIDVVEEVALGVEVADGPGFRPTPGPRPQPTQILGERQNLIDQTFDVRGLHRLIAGNTPGLDGFLSQTHPAAIQPQPQRSGHGTRPPVKKRAASWSRPSKTLFYH